MMKTYSQFKREALKRKGVREAYDALGSEFEVITSLIQRRLDKGLTQRELATRIGTQQSAIARLESGTYNPSIDFLRRVTSALGAQLQITLVPKTV